MLFLEPVLFESAPTQDGLNVRLYLTCGTFSLGRPLKGASTGQTDIVLYGDSSISKVHGEIVVSSDGHGVAGEGTLLTVTYFDKSRYGTFVNDMKVVPGQATQLHVGDVLKLGPKTRFTLMRHPVRLLVPPACSILAEILRAALDVGAEVSNSVDPKCTHFVQCEGEEVSSLLAWAISAQLPVVTPEWLKTILRQRVLRTCLPAETSCQPSSVLLPNLEVSNQQLVPVPMHTLLRPPTACLAGYMFTGVDDEALKAAVVAAGGMAMPDHRSAGQARKHIQIVTDDIGARSCGAPMTMSAAALTACILLGRDPATTALLRRSGNSEAAVVASTAVEDAVEDITDEEEDPVEMSTEPLLAAPSSTVPVGLMAPPPRSASAPGNVSVVASLLSNLLSDDEDEQPAAAAPLVKRRPPPPRLAPDPAPSQHAPSQAPAAVTAQAVVPPVRAAIDAEATGAAASHEQPRQGAGTSAAAPASAEPLVRIAGQKRPFAALDAADKHERPVKQSKQDTNDVSPVAAESTVGGVPQPLADAAHLAPGTNTTSTGGAQQPAPTATASTAAPTVWGCSEIIVQPMFLQLPTKAASSSIYSNASGLNFKRFRKQLVAKSHHDQRQLRVEQQRVDEEDAALVEQYAAQQRQQHVADELFEAQLKARKPDAVVAPARRVRA